MLRFIKGSSGLALLFQYLQSPELSFEVDDIMPT